MEVAMVFESQAWTPISTKPTSNDRLWLTCATHALSTEAEEIMGLLLGDIHYDHSGRIPVVSAKIWGAAPQVRADRRKDRVETTPEQLAAASAEAERMSAATGMRTRVIGWYHSHPHITVHPSHVDDSKHPMCLFPSLSVWCPSDVRTQGMYQMLDEGFVGLIFSAFNRASSHAQAGQLQAVAFQSVSARDKEQREQRSRHTPARGQWAQLGTKREHSSHPSVSDLEPQELAVVLAAVDDDVPSSDFTAWEVPIKVVPSARAFPSLPRAHAVAPLTQLQRMLLMEEKEAYEKAVEHAGRHGEPNPLELIHHHATYQAALCRLMETCLVPAIAALENITQSNKAALRLKQEEQARASERASHVQEQFIVHPSGAAPVIAAVAHTPSPAHRNPAVILMKVILVKVILVNVILVEVILVEVILMKVLLVKVILMKVILMKVILVKVILVKVILVKVILVKVILMNVILMKVVLVKVILVKVILVKVILVKVILMNVILMKVVLVKVVLVKVIDEGDSGERDSDEGNSGEGDSGEDDSDEGDSGEDDSGEGDSDEGDSGEVDSDRGDPGGDKDDGLAAHLKSVLAAVLGELRDVDTTEAVSQIAELCQLLAVTDPHCLPSGVTHLSTRAWHCDQLLQRMQQTQASLQERQEQVTALAECIESWKAQLPSDDDISRATDDVADKIRRTAQEQQQLSLQRSAAQGSLEAAGYSADVDMAALLQLAAEVQGEEEEVGRLQQDLAIYSDLPTLEVQREGEEVGRLHLAIFSDLPSVWCGAVDLHAPAEGEGAPALSQKLEAWSMGRRWRRARDS
ncbi:unnamed protein product [Closterium sp. Yama58-4]|nr:unnamed protein product [Closterium sp. Yama58-4]